MRLSLEVTRVIQDTFVQVFEKGDLYLFGSRVDDARKGGDIDLYVDTDKRERLGEKRIEFLARIKRHIGDQRIDLVVARGAKRSIDEIATSEGILLCQRH
jgi:predicted nucleotidyltransferase